MIAETAPICPHCGQLDAVRKVSALHMQGISTTSYTVPAIQDKRTAVSRTALSERLTPPAKPYRPVNSSLSLSWLIVLAIIGVLAGIGMISGGLSLGDRGGGLPLFGILFIVFVLISIFSAISKSGQAREAFEARMKAYNRTMADYESARLQWDLAYYCGRCDGVFVPGMNEFISINQFQQFINRFSH